MDHDKSRPVKIEIRELEAIIPLHKSQRLSSLRNKTVPEGQNCKPLSNTFSNNTQDELLTHAQMLIDSKIQAFMDSLPAGRKNKLFTVRFGSIEAIKSMPVEQAFKVLQIDSQKIDLKPLAGKNYYGNRVE